MGSVSGSGSGGSGGSGGGSGTGGTGDGTGTGSGTGIGGAAGPGSGAVGGGGDGSGAQSAGPGLRCLVTGGTGYIGGRLVPELLAAGHQVRCLARSPEKLRDHPWSEQVERVRGDVTDANSLGPAMRDIDIAYYLVHALGSGRGFEETDREAARTFGEAARAAGVRRIVYLGGLIPDGVPEERLSPHLRSRTEVGRILLESGVPTTVLRAAVWRGRHPRRAAAAAGRRHR